MSASATAPRRLEFAEWVELAAVALVAGGAWLLAPRLPGDLALGELVVGLAALLLLQTLVRDLWLIWSERGTTRALPRRARCLCVESVVGVAGIVAGVLLLVAGVLPAVEVGRLALALAVGGVLLAGFWIRDLVLEFSPVRVRREPDHRNLVVSWRR